MDTKKFYLGYWNTSGIINQEETEEKEAKWLKKCVGLAQWKKEAGAALKGDENENQT